MEQWKDSLQTAMDERFDAAFAELKKSNPHVRHAVKQQVNAAEAVNNHPKYDDELKQIVDAYFEAMQLLLGEFGQHLYIQGAKDCVTVLRKLGIIK